MNRRLGGIRRLIRLGLRLGMRTFTGMSKTTLSTALMYLDLSLLSCMKKMIELITQCQILAVLEFLVFQISRKTMGLAIDIKFMTIS